MSYLWYMAPEMYAKINAHDFYDLFNHFLSKVDKNNKLFESRAILNNIENPFQQQRQRQKQRYGV